MDIWKVFATNEVHMSAEEADEVNKHLSEVSASDIPKSQIDSIEDYIVTALNVESVRRPYDRKLSELLHEIRLKKTQESGS